MQADSNRAKLRYSRETNWGETASGPATTALRITSESLNHEKQTVVSEEVRSDRQRAEILEVGQAASGDINYELSWSDFEPFFETTLRNAIVSTRVANASTVFAANTITGSAAADFTGFQKGQWIRINGGANNGAVAQISTVTSTVLTITGTTLVASTASAHVTGRTIKNGTATTSYFVEVDFEDINGVKYFNGARVDGMSLNVASQQIVTGTFSFLAKRGFTASTSVASTTTSGGTYTPMTAAVNVGEIREGGSVFSTAVQSITLNVANNMRARPQVGAKTSAEHGDGGLDVTGNLTVFFENIALLNKMINHSGSSLSVRLNDADSNTIVITIPNLKYQAGSPAVPGQDQDVFLALDFTALRDTVSDSTIRMDFLPVS